MESKIPIIYSPQFGAPHIGWYGRVVAAAAALACLAVLTLASQLTPSAGGTGTHEQIGLNPCQWQLRTGVPCLSCGMTTSFAHFSQGRLLSGLYTQPMGFVLAVLTAMAVWSGGYIAITGRPAHRIAYFLPGGAILWSLAGLALLAWGWKILIQLQGWDGWL